jgi:hypothetical protein
LSHIKTALSASLIAKDQLAFQSKFECPADEPQDCRSVGLGSDSHKVRWSLKPECSLDKADKSGKTEATDELAGVPGSDENKP